MGGPRGCCALLGGFRPGRDGGFGVQFQEQALGLAHGRSPGPPTVVSGDPPAPPQGLGVSLPWSPVSPNAQKTTVKETSSAPKTSLFLLNFYIFIKAATALGRGGWATPSSYPSLSPCPHRATAVGQLWGQTPTPPCHPARPVLGFPVPVPSASPGEVTGTRA